MLRLFASQGCVELCFYENDKSTKYKRLKLSADIDNLLAYESKEPSK